MDRINDIPIGESQNSNNEPVTQSQKKWNAPTEEEDLCFTFLKNVHEAAANGNIAAKNAEKTEQISTPSLPAPPKDPESITPIAASKISPPPEKTTPSVKAIIIKSFPPPLPPQPMPAIPSRVAEYLANNNKHLSTPSKEPIVEPRSAVSSSLQHLKISDTVNLQPNAPSITPEITTKKTPSTAITTKHNESTTINEQLIQASSKDENIILNQNTNIANITHFFKGQLSSHKDLKNLSPAERELVITYNTKTHAAVTSLKGQQYYQQHPEALKSLNLPKGAKIFVLSDSAWKTFTTLLDQKIDEWQKEEAVKKHAHHAPKVTTKTPKEPSQTATKQDIIQNAVTAFENTKQESLAHKLSELFKMTVDAARIRIEKKRKEQKELQEDTFEAKKTEQQENEKVQIEELCKKIEADYEELERLIIKDLLREQDLNTPDTTITPST